RPRGHASLPRHGIETTLDHQGKCNASSLLAGTSTLSSCGDMVYFRHTQFRKEYDFSKVRKSPGSNSQFMEPVIQRILNHIGGPPQAPGSLPHNPSGLALGEASLAYQADSLWATSWSRIAGRARQAGWLQTESRISNVLEISRSRADR